MWVIYLITKPGGVTILLTAEYRRHDIGVQEEKLKTKGLIRLTG